MPGSFAEEEGNQRYQVLHFSDNGIGFEQEFASAIFKVFTRLHSQALYEGSGIGLALCKKNNAGAQRAYYSHRRAGRRSCISPLFPGIERFSNNYPATQSRALAPGYRPFRSILTLTGAGS